MHHREFVEYATEYCANRSHAFAEVNRKLGAIRNIAFNEMDLGRTFCNLEWELPEGTTLTLTLSLIDKEVGFRVPEVVSMPHRETPARNLVYVLRQMLELNERSIYRWGWDGNAVSVDRFGGTRGVSAPEAELLADGLRRSVVDGRPLLLAALAGHGVWVLPTGWPKSL